MPQNQETEEEDDDGIFPILNRQTPILDRIQERRQRLNGTSTKNIANQIARSALTNDSVDEELLSNLRTDIASELEIPEDEINDIYISRLRDVLSPSLDELITQRNTGLQDPNSESEEDSQEVEENIEEDENVDNAEDNIEENENESSGPAFPSESDNDSEESGDDEEPESVF